MGPLIKIMDRRRSRLRARISRVLWHRHSCLCTCHIALEIAPVYTTAGNRGNDKAADRRTRGPICNVARLVSKCLQLGWRHTFSDTCSPRPFVVLATAMELSRCRRGGMIGSSRVRGRALLSFRLEPVIRQRSLLSLQIETCAPFNSCLAHCPLSLSISCLRTLSRYCRSRTLTWSRLRVILWIGLQDWARAGTFEPSSPII
jgi:hypothetical protein